MNATPGQPPQTPPAAQPPPPAAPGAPAPPAAPPAAAGAVLAVNGQPPAAPAPPAAQPGQAPPEPWGKVGTVVMAIAVGAAIVVLADIAFKGRILGPLFAMFTPRQPPPAGDQPDGDG